MRPGSRYAVVPKYLRRLGLLATGYLVACVEPLEVAEEVTLTATQSDAALQNARSQPVRAKTEHLPVAKKASPTPAFSGIGAMPPAVYVRPSLVQPLLDPEHPRVAQGTCGMTLRSLRLRRVRFYPPDEQERDHYDAPSMFAADIEEIRTAKGVSSVNFQDPDEVGNLEWRLTSAHTDIRWLREKVPDMWSLRVEPLAQMLLDFQQWVPEGHTAIAYDRLCQEVRIRRSTDEREDNGVGTIVGEVSFERVESRVKIARQIDIRFGGSLKTRHPIRCFERSVMGEWIDRLPRETNEYSWGGLPRKLTRVTQDAVWYSYDDDDLFFMWRCPIDDCRISQIKQIKEMLDDSNNPDSCSDADQVAYLVGTPAGRIFKILPLDDEDDYDYVYDPFCSHPIPRLESILVSRFGYQDSESFRVGRDPQPIVLADTKDKLRPSERTFVRGTKGDAPVLFRTRALCEEYQRVHQLSKKERWTW